MQKDELISLTNEMCKELLSIIEEQEGEATREQVAKLSSRICSINYEY